MNIDRQSRTAIVVCLVALALAACSGGGGPADSGAGDGTTPGADTSTTDVVNQDVSFPTQDVISRGSNLQCSGHDCACADGMDNDSDGLPDALDPECVSPYDDDEGSFATGIPGDNMAMSGMEATECFFDGDSGPGNDGDCNVPNGCDCRGCCEVDVNGSGTRERVSIRTNGCSTVTRTATPNVAGGPCTPGGDGGTGSCMGTGLYCVPDGDGTTHFCASCAPCSFSTASDCITNPCSTGERCVGDPPPPPPGDGGTDGGTAPVCPSGLRSCLNHNDCLPLGMSFYCITGCCEDVPM